MPNKPSIPVLKLNQVKKLYYKENFSMSDIAEKLGVSLDAVVYFMRRHNLKRRNFSEANTCLFKKKAPSFSQKPIKNIRDKELKAIGAMLYWGEGHKTRTATRVDFANSDPEMVYVFLAFLRNTYNLNEDKFRVLVYCYQDQDFRKITSFWSKLTGISKDKFTKPYIRKDFRDGGRKMPNGLIHIRYNDKKLLLEIKKLIEYYKQKFCVGSPVGGGNGL